jgi:thiamine biosynthesis lipoprotein ApbE
MKKTFAATGTIWSLKIIHKNNSKSLSKKTWEVLTYCQKNVLEFEQKYSRFKENSIISKLNQKKEIFNPEPEILDILKKIIEIEKITYNNFNPWMAAELSNLGYGNTKTKSTKKLDK